MLALLPTRLFAAALVALVAFGTAPVQAQVNFYDSRAAFEADFPGLAVEDFEEANFPAGPVSTCDAVINSASNDDCFDPGDIIPGVDFTSAPPSNMVALQAGLIGGGQTSSVIGPNTFDDTFVIEFTGNAFAAGMTVFSNVTGPISVEVFNTGGVQIGSTSIANVSNVGTFFGFESAVAVGSFTLSGGAGVGELIDDFSFSESPIPVELTSFTATANGQAILLAWETASETNNAGFEVQMRQGETWLPLGFVEGHGTTTEAQAYSYTAEGLGVGAHTFRLKQIDFDGAFEYSPEVEATVETPGTHLLSNAYPNPFNPQAQFTLAVAQEQHVTASLYNTLGQRVAVLFDGTLEANAARTLLIDGSGLASGRYLVRIQGERFADALQVTLLK